MTGERRQGAHPLSTVFGLATGGVAALTGDSLWEMIAIMAVGFGQFVWGLYLGDRKARDYFGWP